MQIVNDNNMFKLAECVFVLLKGIEKIDQAIMSWYIRILIAAHIDTGFTDTATIPSMLTFQYEQVRFAKLLSQRYCAFQRN